MKKAAAPKKKRPRFIFATELIGELKKVVWPTRPETVRLTIMVLVICLAIGALLGAMDYLLAHFLVEKVFLGVD